MSRVSERSFKAIAAPYRDAISLQTALQLTGSLFKIVGAVGAIGGSIWGLGEGPGGIFGFVIVALSLVAGGVLFALGVVISAIGQIIIALVDTAIATNVLAASGGSVNGAAAARALLLGGYPTRPVPSLCTVPGCRETAEGHSGMCADHGSRGENVQVP